MTLHLKPLVAPDNITQISQDFICKYMFCSDIVIKLARRKIRVEIACRTDGPIRCDGNFTSGSVALTYSQPDGLMTLRELLVETFLRRGSL